MTAKDLAKVMGEQFIAVGIKGKDVSYSGRASQFKSWLENREVTEVFAPKDKYSATVIYVQ